MKPQLYESIKCAEEMFLSCTKGDPFFDGMWRNGPHSIKEWTENAICTGFEDHAVFTRTDCLNAIAEGINVYLERMPATPTIKHNYRRRFLDLLCTISSKYKLNLPRSECNRMLDTYVIEDQNVLLLKELHAQEGRSYSDLAEALGVTEQSIENRLPKLGRNLRDKQQKPQYWAGQIIEADIQTRERKAESGQLKKYFYTSQTIHPVAFQLNMLQVGSLLQSLCYANTSNVSRVSLSIAVDLWIQLSDYAKNRIREVFLPGNPVLAQYIEQVDQLAKSKDRLQFVIEDDLPYSEEYFTITEKLYAALKGDYRCDIKLRKNGEELLLKDVTISIIDGRTALQFSAIPYEQSARSEQPVVFSPNEVISIGLLY